MDNIWQSMMDFGKLIPLNPANPYCMQDISIFYICHFSGAL